MLSEALPDSEKLDQIHALIPSDVFKIDNLNQATPAQLRQLKEALEFGEAIQQLGRSALGKRTPRGRKERDPERRPSKT